MEDKIGVFICTGYGIAEALDIDALSKVATDEYKIQFCKTIDSCEKNDLKTINNDIKNEGLNKVIIAGISPRRFEDDMFPEDVIVEKIGLREQVVWCQPANEEDTQMMAEDYLRMYISKIQKMEPLEPFKSEDAIDKCSKIEKIYDPDPDNNKTYNKMFEVYLDIHNKLKDIYKKIKEYTA